MEEIANFFEVSLATIKIWKKKHPRFVAAIKKGGIESDANVAHSTYRRAIGYSHPDVHISNYQGQITVTPIVKHYPPDPASCAIWLNNRRSANWRRNVGEGEGDNTPPPTKIEVVVTDARKPSASS